ncbi:MAG: hypothetical protein RIC52_10595 [Amphiplicatus sp.]
MNEYNLIDSRASHYAKLLHWNAEEAVCLLLGKNPNIVLQRIARSSSSAFERTIEYRELKQIFNRSAHLIGHGDKFSPINVLEWGIHYEVSVPKFLIGHVEKFHGPIQQWNPSEGYLALRRAPVLPKSGASRKGLDKPDDVREADGDELNLKAKTSLLRLVAGMAICGYSFNPNAERNNAIRDIEGDLYKLGIPLNNQTIRAWLHEAATLIDWAAVDEAITEKFRNPKMK